jgi:hypothetical protein
VTATFVEYYEVHIPGEMTGREEPCDYSMDSVRSPLKPAFCSYAKKVGSEHTSDVEVPEGSMEKTEYEIARDVRVAKIQEMMKPVREAARAL